MPDVHIDAAAPDDADTIAAVRELFTEYAGWLSPIVAHTTIAEEIASLPAPFDPPHGQLLVARDEAGVVCGCVGVKRHDERACEIKRLFIRAQYRGLGLGRALFSAALSAGCQLGYSEALVSTVPSHMPEALHMYERFGFTPTERFEDHTHADIDIRFMRLDLGTWCAHETRSSD